MEAFTSPVWKHSHLQYGSIHISSMEAFTSPVWKHSHLQYGSIHISSMEAFTSPVWKHSHLQYGSIHISSMEAFTSPVWEHSHLQYGSIHISSIKFADLGIQTVITEALVMGDKYTSIVQLCAEVLQAVPRASSFILQHSARK
ncbi:hypothetical protein BsWGS_06821 [Bradybaena similaris]